MIQMFKNSGFATVLTVLIVICSILSGAARSLGGLRTEAEEFFTGGADGGKGIEHDLERIVANSYNLVTIARRYFENDNVVLAAVVNNRVALMEADSPKEKHHAAVNLIFSARFLAAEIKETDIKLSDIDYAEECIVNIIASEKVISISGYNQAARAFNETISRFPANILRLLVGIGPLELYE